jgi:hypothetical protein
MMNKRDDNQESAAEMFGTTDKDLPIDPSVILPADVQATITRGEAAFKGQGRKIRMRDAINSGAMPRIITSVVDQQVQDSRDIVLDTRELQSEGTRQQPPMIGRLRAVMILVDRLLADGVPFGVGPNSKMNKALHNWLSAKAGQSTDIRKSRRKVITPGAVRELLKQVRALRR